MRNLLVLFTAAALAACAATGPASPDDEPIASTVQATMPAESVAGASSLQRHDPGYWDQKVCRREAVTGTRLPQTRCYTRREWAQMSEAARESMRDIEARRPATRADD